MATRVEVTEAPGRVLDEAADFLASDPVRHNLILALLHNRVAHPEPGRYWIVLVGDAPAGVVFQSPLDFIATMTPMSDDAVTATVDAIVGYGVQLPGASGEAGTVARFAGHWAERTKTAACPVQAQRIYEVERPIPAYPVPGDPRQATDGDRDILVSWLRALQAETGDPPGEAATVIERRLAAGHLWLWHDDGPVAIAGLSDPVAGVVRMGPVYTPPQLRNRGYASALVAEVSSATRAKGLRCILYTDLGNPTSNSIYRKVGFRAVAEALRYRFDTGC